MSKIHAVILIPEEGDPRKLLGDPESVAWRCGARPPIATELRIVPRDERAPITKRWVSGHEQIDALRRALVLAWGGEVVHEAVGWVQDGRCVDVMGIAQVPEWKMDVAMLLAGNDWIVEIADSLDGLGTIVLLDSDGNEVTP